MAMNKKEKQMVEGLKIASALRWTAPIEPDIPMPTGSGPLVAGFSYHTYSKRVEISCSSSIYHARGRNDRTTTQNPIAQYSTKILALRAMRYEVERMAALELYKVDQMIEEELDSRAINPTH